MKTWSRMMLAMGLAQTVLAGGLAAAQAPGSGPGYEAVGKVPVMHAGRVKPLDTVAREEVKQVYGRETIKLVDPAREIDRLLGVAGSAGGAPQPESWNHTAAFLGWFMAPEFWDEQPFILVDYLPLKRLLLSQPLNQRLTAIAAKSATSEADRQALRRLAQHPEPSGTLLKAYLAGSKLPLEDKRTIAELALKLSEDHRWMSPRELDEARVTVQDQTRSFIDWATELEARQRRFSANPQAAQRLSEIERRAVEAANRLLSYQAYSSPRLQTNGLVLIMPRPSNDRYLKAMNAAIQKARAAHDMNSTSLLELDELKAVSTFWNDIPIGDRHDPTSDEAFDARFQNWLEANAVWTPVQVLLQSKPEDLEAAGYPGEPLRAFVAAYRSFAAAESASPGHAPDSLGIAFLTTARALGEAINPVRYPTTAVIERETYFNKTNPFYTAPVAYGLALVLMACSLSFMNVLKAKTFSGLLGRAIYSLGLAALACGIGLEIYGFYFRVRISGWAPVTNMYETVIWVSLVAAVLSLIFELIYRRGFIALAGAGVALLGTITAANVPLLDPSIKSLQPVLRSNFWLTIHVLTEVSSYAAFALAWNLGLIALGFYLTSTYRRSPRLGELALLLIPGLPLLAIGGLGVAASYGMLGQTLSLGTVPTAGIDYLFYLCVILALTGLCLSLASLLAIGGELFNRLVFREAYLSQPVAGAPGHADPRSLAMQHTSQAVKPLSNFIYRTMQVGVLLIAAGTILGGVWADVSWGRFWGWDPKEVWALITLLVYLIPLHGRFAGWISSFGLVVASAFCFLSVIMAWYGVNFVLGVGLHTYGFVEAGYQGAMSVIITCMLSLPIAATLRRKLGQRPAERSPKSVVAERPHHPAATALVSS